MLKIFDSENFGSVNPYKNLAFEEFLFRKAEQNGDSVLYLWQNDCTVVIGRNQNAYTEFSNEASDKYKCKIARRLTGGGAVFHDLGNLNFTLIIPLKLYNNAVTTAVIENVMKELEIPYEISGRNDILAEGRKFSGSAYYIGTKSALHHGTIMLNVDLNKMQEILHVPTGKMAKKGVKSVKSRVVNLCELKRGLTVKDVKEAFKTSAEKVLNVAESGLITSLTPEDISELKVLEKRYSSEEWIYKRFSEFTQVRTQGFSWGELCVNCQMSGDKIISAVISSDSLFPDMVDSLEKYTNEYINSGLHGPFIFNIKSCSQSENQAAKEAWEFCREIFEKKDNL